MQDDNTLIQKARSGDMGAFEQLLYRYDRHVLNIAYSFRNSEDDAKDIYQEVFIRVYKGLKNFQFRSEFSTWLYRITTNVCISYKRKEGRHNLDSLDVSVFEDEESSAKLSDLIEGEETTDDLAISSDYSKYINRALETLPAQQKMAFTLKYYQGYKVKEIAGMMQCAEGTIKRYLFNAANKMREQLKGIIDN